MSKDKQKGFSLAELLIVVGIISILAAVGFASYGAFRNRASVEGEITKLTAITREAMERSRSQADGSGWGLHLANPSGSGNDFYELWKGASYASGTVTQRVNLSANARFTDPAEGETKDLIFEKTTGLLGASSSIVIESLAGGGVGTINIDTSGRVNYSLN